MKSNSIFQVPAVLMAGLLALGLGTTGCPDPETTPADAGEVDAGPGDAGEVDAGPQLEPGDTCENALELVPGTTTSGDTTGLNNDYDSDCGGDGAPDIVYTFTLDEASGVQVTVKREGSMDPVVHFMTGACLASDVLACTDDPQTASADEIISFGLLDPGTYFVVVDGYSDSAGAFTIDLEVVAGGICVADAVDADGGNDTVEDSLNAYLGDSDLTDTADLAPTICEGDVDWYIFGHMGGNLAVDATALDTQGTLGSEVFGANVVFGEESVTVSQGDSLGNTPVDQDAPRGYYLARFDGADLGQTGLPYSFTITHACLPDGDDAILPEQDDEVYERAAYVFSQNVEEAEPVVRTVCGSDVDVMGITNVVPGDIVVTLGGAGTGVNATFSSVAEQEDGTFVLTEITEGLTVETVGDDLVVTLAGAEVGRYALTVSAPEATQTVEYELVLAFGGLAGPPANDTCGGAETLTAATEPTVTYGRTMGGTHDIIGPCGNEQIAIDNEYDGALDVFYALNVPEQSDIRIDFDGSINDFMGQVYLLQAQAECPADLSTLVPVQNPDAAPVCAVGTDLELYFPSLPAGDYLVVVDGFFTVLYGIFPYWTEGGFELTATVFPDGFPEPEACVNAETLELPAAGTPTTIAVDPTSLTNDFTRYACASPITGPDKVFAITPAADVEVTFSASGEQEIDGEIAPIDTVLAILTGSCLPDVGSTVACHDDVDYQNGDPSSTITTTLTAGETYYLFVDGYDPELTATIDLTVSVQ